MKMPDAFNGYVLKYSQPLKGFGLVYYRIVYFIDIK